MKQILVSIISVVILSFSLQSFVHCQTKVRKIVKPEISNPAIRKNLQTRTTRLTQLIDFKSNEFIGENHLAELQIINIKRIPEHQRHMVEDIVEAENMDRKKMFLLIAEAKGWDISKLTDIRENYAQAIRKEAIKGEWIQMQDELWQMKE